MWSFIDEEKSESLIKTEVPRMATLKEEAQAYEPKLTKNIAELRKIPVDLDLKTDHGTDDKGEPYEFKFIEVEGERYRIPGSVLGGIKGVLKKMPNTTHVTVERTGTGLNTRYQVMPFVE